ncbi:MAG: LacI family DNA-binding transcriptional regulator [Marinobacter sp.]|uniref:LacI family DNA-binding transcriptional regulator n=1 Tax=Marinobacter sp. TaxID=50741 RepID=UPI001B6D7D86|nr:LacI family DNA-binding transcriptional regulator [Marinobacter sp.]MBQ0748008.1 LacI family DNA-binding transcriptional regulator [Marinobacter sp.]MBQ0815927.1 LacI family DNA-binding transcriptional regulator [Marinobacter sp.]|tara:strand:+ start:2026 stop:3054 length:1029 start_codon:yes stop_codon:yes gene_type:complete
MSSSKTKRQRRGVMQPTIADVAMEARVSAITVSRVLNSPDVVRPATRARVEAAIDKVGYVRNMLAGSLASASSRFIAVIVPSLSNIVFIEVINGLQSEFERQGYQILLANTGYDLDRECQLVRTFLGWSPSALVVTGLRHNDACQRILSECDSPIAEIMELGDAIDLNIGLDHPEAGRCMARYLLGKGHRNIVYVAAQVARDYRAGLRYDGHREVLEAAGLRAPLLDMGQLGQFETGAQALDRVLADYPDASAIHFANDDLAAGALLHAQRQGIRVPETIAIAGFNGLPIGQHVTPRLTTITSPRHRIGRLAAEQVIARIEGRALSSNQTDVSFELAIGESA